jgi:antirestriction protein
MSSLRGFITNLGLYNAGRLVGKWIEFPIDEESLEEVKKEIKIDENHEEWFFTDYECDVNGVIDKLGEYELIDRLNEVGELVEKIEDESLDDAFSAILSGGYNFDDAAQKAIDRDFSEISTAGYSNVDEAIGNYFADMCGIEDLPRETLERYFDYESYGRDLRLEGNFVEQGDKVYEIY